MRNKNVSKRLMLTPEKADELNEFLKDNDMTFQELIESYVDAVLENKDYFDVQKFIEEKCKNN